MNFFFTDVYIMYSKFANQKLLCWNRETNFYYQNDFL